MLGGREDVRCHVVREGALALRDRRAGRHVGEQRLTPPGVDRIPGIDHQQAGGQTPGDETDLDRLAQHLEVLERALRNEEAEVRVALLLDGAAIEPYVELLQAALIDLALDAEQRRKLEAEQERQRVRVDEERARQIDVRGVAQAAALVLARDQVGGRRGEDLLHDLAGLGDGPALRSQRREPPVRPARDRRSSRPLLERVRTTGILLREPRVLAPRVVLGERGHRDLRERRVPVLPRNLELLHQQRAARVALERPLAAARGAQRVTGVAREHPHRGIAARGPVEVEAARAAPPRHQLDAARRARVEDAEEHVRAVRATSERHDEAQRLARVVRLSGRELAPLADHEGPLLLEGV